MYLPAKLTDQGSPWPKIFSVLVGLYGVAILTSMAAMEIVSWLTFAAVLASGFYFYQKITFKELLAAIRLGPDIWLWAFFGIVALGLLKTPVTDGNLDLWAILGSLRWIILLYTMTWALLWIPRPTIFKLWHGFFALIFLIALYSLAQFLWGIDFFHSKQTVWASGNVFRAPGLFNSSLTFAYVIGGFGFVGAGRLWDLPFKEWFKREQWPWLLGIFGAMIGCVTSLTRGSWIAFVVASAIVLLLVRPRRLVALVVALLLAFSVGMMANGGLRDRIASLYDAKYTSNVHRTIIWRANWEIVKANPWLGVGYGLNSHLTNEYFDKYKNFSLEQSEDFFKSLSIPRRDIATHAHNNFLHTLVGTGVFGLFCFLAFCFYFLRQAWRLYKNAKARQDTQLAALALGLFGAQIFFHIGGLTECNFTDSEVTHMLILNWAMVLGCQIPFPGHTMSKNPI